MNIKPSLLTLCVALGLTLTAAAARKPLPKPEPVGVIALSVGSRAGRFTGWRNSSAHSLLAGYPDGKGLEVRCVRST